MAMRIGQKGDSSTDIPIKARSSDVVWSYAGTGSTMLVNLALLPILIRYINNETLGLWYVYLSIGGMVTLFDFGFNPTIARNIAYCWSGARAIAAEGKIDMPPIESGKPNLELLKKLQITCRALYGIIAGAALLLMATAGTAYILSLSATADHQIVLTSWTIYTIAVTLNLYYGYFATFLRGVGAVKRYYQIVTVARVAQLVISIALVIVGLDIIAPASAYLCYGLLLRVLSKYGFLTYENIGKRLSSVETKSSFIELRKLFITMWHNAWRDGIVSLSAYLAGQATTIVGSAFLSLTETGVYSISVQLVTAIMTISSVSYSARQPALQSAYFRDDREAMKKDMARSMVVMFVMYFILLVGLVLVGAPMLSVIRPGTTFDPIVILYLGICNYLYKRMMNYASFISNMNSIPYMPAFVVSSAIGIVLSVLLMDVGLGVWGLLVGQTLPQLVYNCWKWPKVVYKYLNTSLVDMLRTGIDGVKNARSLQL